MMHWIGPYRIDDVLDCFFRPDMRQPPERSSVYLVSQEPWESEPTLACLPLYVGGAKNPNRFRTRVGLLISHMLGFFSQGEGMHKNGESLYKYCKEKGCNAGALYIGWLESCQCHRCAEVAVYDELQPLLNEKRPPACRQHGG